MEAHLSRVVGGRKGIYVPHSLAMNIMVNSRERLQSQTNLCGAVSALLRAETKRKPSLVPMRLFVTCQKQVFDITTKRL